MEIDNKTKKILEYTQSLFNEEVFLCGGACRDLIMGNKPKDYDFCTSLTPDEIKEQLKGKHRVYCIGEKFGTLTFVPEINNEKIDIEITTFRCNEKYGKSRKPEVNFCSDLVEDLNRRDFTCNALCISGRDFRLIDEFGGQDDIKNGTLRCVANPKIRFKEDSLRILRAIRFATKYEFEIEEKTLKALKKQTFSLLNISKERWVMEIDKILLDKNCANGLRMLWKYGIFKVILPELGIQYNYDQNSIYHNLTLDEHTTSLVEQANKAGEDISILWACLLHDVGKPFTRTDKSRDIKTNEHAKKVSDYLSKNNANLQGKHIYDGSLHTSHYIGHELVGACIAERLCDYLKFSNKRKNLIVKLIRTHLSNDCPIKKYDDNAKSELSKELEDVFLK